MKHRHPLRGFTLVELAIAVTVIGLLIGGIILGGSALLESTRISTLVSQIKDVAAASREFKGRYGYFPGDLPNAATYVTTDGGVSVGCSYAIGGTVGNGLVDSATESTCALEHLVKARLLSRIEWDTNTSAYVIRHPFGLGFVSLSVIAATNENAVRITALPCNIAQQIDAKLDSDAATPLATGFVIGLDASGTAINTCTPGGANDPVATLLVRY